MIVIDSNIIFSALLTTDSKFLTIIMDDENKFVAPYFLFIELFKHKEKILKLTKISEEQLLIIFDVILYRIEFIPIALCLVFSMSLANC